MNGLTSLNSLNDLAKAAQQNPTQTDGKQILTVPTDDVVSKIQVRKRFRNIEELGNSILEEGQQSAIIVSPKNEDGKYVIQKGERRWRACKEKRIATIDVVVNEDPQTRIDEVAGELIENIQRDDLAALEVAEGLFVLKQEGLKQQEIAKRIGKGESFVSTHLSLLKLPDCVVELYNNEVTGDTETMNNLRLLFNENEERCRAVCKVALTNGITRAQSRDLLNDAKRPKSEPTEQSSEVEKNIVESEPDTISEICSDNTELDKQSDTNQNDDQEKPGSNQGQHLSLVKEANNSSNKTSEPKGKDWKAAQADSIIITVSVISEKSVARGVLMMDRVAVEPDTVWVKMLDSQGKMNPVRVPASEIEIISIES